MFRRLTAHRPTFSARGVLAVTAVIAVATTGVLATAAGHSPVSASGPQADQLLASSSTVSPATQPTVVTPNSSASIATDQPPSPSASPVTPAVPLDAPAVVGSTPAWSSDPAADPTSPAAPASAETLITGRAMYATDSANVRSAPGTDAAVAAALSGGEPVTAGVTVDGWVPVHVGDVYGWTSAEYLADGAPAAQAPAPPTVSSGNWMTDLIPQVDPAGIATWVFERNGSWGASDGYSVWIDPDLPSDKRFSVMVHEYSHVLQVRVYGSLDGSVAGLSALIGRGSADVSANESTADCMALMLGATWVNYGCRDSLQAAASAILAGQRP
jgi:uncharacterized protein YraI